MVNFVSNFSIFKRGSRTYFYSSLFFPSSVRSEVFKLYSFVRSADNLVDTNPPQKELFKKFLRDYKSALKAKKVNNDIIVQFIELSKKHRFEDTWINAFLEAMKTDLKKKKYQNIKEVEEYMFGSAEVIGLMMAKILLLPEQSFKGARLLGKAMQYANFIRDIDEDLTLGRIYIPQTSLKKYGFTTLQHQKVVKKLRDFDKLLKEQTRLFNNWQAEAEEYLQFIPYRYRIPVQTASDMYKWTIKQIEKEPLIIYKKKVKPSVLRILGTILKNCIVLLPWKTFISISRPRFWFYLAGPYLVGTALAAHELSQFYSFFFWIHFFFFLFPANLFIYGVNDLFDRDTDQFNPKKERQENLLKENQLKMLNTSLRNTFLLSVCLIFLQPNLISGLMILIFLVLSIIYSAPPFRLKARPFLDSTSNIFYVLPGLTAFAQVQNVMPPVWVIFTGGLWTTAMHLFSAIPDILADKKAKLSTTATVLGERNSLWLCILLWISCAVSAFFFTQIWWTSLFFVYPMMPLLTLAAKIKVSKVYWFFPKLTALIGFLFFWLIIFSKDLI